ncbi:MAG: vitamin K epoxide reductase family protein [Actinobacteria bacterium]|nr:vitamin K epoxide reductase family protein [Actinomycetota bacterium]MBO0784823.1 vitamin K epoxide reductase family protein [Actinomycetota bacterium]
MKGTRGGRPEAQPVAAARRQPGAQSRPQPRAQSRPRPPRQQDAGTAARPDPGAAAPAADAARAPLPFQLVTLALAVAGLGVSVYLTIAHYTTAVTLACASNGAINCEKVTTSPESVVFGIFPVAVLGLAFYVAMVALTTPWAWRSRLPVIGWARLAAVVTGIGFVIYLIYVELFMVNAICLWCTSVHVITFVLFCLVVTSAALWGTGQAQARR